VTAAVDGALDTAKITDQTLYVEKRKVIDKVRSIGERDGSAACGVRISLLALLLSISEQACTASKTDGLSHRSCPLV
jgi:hypothetical protein